MSSDDNNIIDFREYHERRKRVGRSAFVPSRESFVVLRAGPMQLVFVPLPLPFPVPFVMLWLPSW
ncbi:hypothetical protein ABIB95_007708 [Bradyrhizobium sp. LA2.1]